MSANAPQTPPLSRASANYLTGSQRAAILVMYLEPKVARKLLEEMSTAELYDIGRAMADVEDVTTEAIEEIIASFVRDLTKASLIPRNGKDYVLDTLPDLIDEKRRAGVAGTLRRELSTAFREFIAEQPPRIIAAVLGDEHPQTAALALLLIGPDHASRVLACFTEDMRYDVSMRMARLDDVPSEVADVIEQELRASLESQGPSRLRMQGVDKAAQVLGRLGAAMQDPLMGRIASEDQALSQVLRRRMVVFTDLQTLADRSVQELMKVIDRPTLLAAMKGAEPPMRDMFLRNVSARAREDIEEELAIMSPIPRSQVKTAQEEIVQLAMKLHSEGTIQLFTGSDEMV
jgi:flagellar motor switch protein FliG